MGRAYTYQCTNCDFKNEYLTGGGFLSKEYFDEGERLVSELKADIQQGKYGEILKAMIDSDQDESLYISCETGICQCSKCHTISVHRRKYIGTGWDDEAPYDLRIDIKQTCPDCNTGHPEWDSKNLLCPQCRHPLRLNSISMWD